jgi:hypothetical protein
MWTDVSKLTVGTEFYVNNGAWDGKIVEVDGKKHLHVLATDRKIDISEGTDGYELDIDVTKKGSAVIGRGGLKDERIRLLDLLKRYAPEFHVTRVSNIEGNRVFLEGGSLPAVFDKEKKQLRVWGRGSRHSGAEVSVSFLVKIEKVMSNWSEEVSFES